MSGAVGTDLTPLLLTLFVFILGANVIGLLSGVDVLGCCSTPCCTCRKNRSSSS